MEQKIILSATLKIRGGCDRDRYGKKAGKGALIQWEKSGTLGVSQDQTLFVWCSYSMQEEMGGVLSARPLPEIIKTG